PDRVGVFGRGRTDQHAPQTSGARDGSLAQLAVLAAAPVDADGSARGVAGALAGDAGAHSGERAAPRLGNALAAIVAMLGALPERRFGPGAQHRVLDRVIDLVLHRAVARPAACHRVNLLPLRACYDGDLRKCVRLRTASSRPLSSSPCSTSNRRAWSRVRPWCAA